MRFSSRVKIVVAAMRASSSWAALPVTCCSRAMSFASACIVSLIGGPGDVGVVIVVVVLVVAVAVVGATGSARSAEQPKRTPTVAMRRIVLVLPPHPLWKCCAS